MGNNPAKKSGQKSDMQKYESLIARTDYKQKHPERFRDISLKVDRRQIQQGKTQDEYIVSFPDNESATGYGHIHLNNITNKNLFDSKGNRKQRVNITLDAHQKYSYSYEAKDENGQSKYDEEGKQVYVTKKLRGTAIEQMYKNIMKEKSEEKSKGQQAEETLPIQDNPTDDEKEKSPAD